MFGGITEQTLKNLVAQRQWQELQRVLADAEARSLLQPQIIA